MTGHGKKSLLIVASVVAVLAVLCLWIVPGLVDVNRYRPQVEALLEQKTGKPAHIGHLALTVFPHLAIEVDNFVMGNPAGFPSGDFINTRRVYAVLDARALWNRKIVIQSLVVKDPAIHLLSAPGGRWNFENPPSPGPGAAAPSKPQAAMFSLGTISTINLDGGLVTIANLLPSGAAGPSYFEVHGISCRFQDVNLSAATASGAPAAMIGKPPLMSLIGSPTIVNAAETAPQPIAHGIFTADTLRFGAIQASSVHSQVWVLPQKAYLDQLTLNLAGGSLKGKANFDFSGQNLGYKIRTIFSNIDVAQLAQAFPNARGKMTGTLQGDLDVEGQAVHTSDPLSGLEGTGQVTIRNGKLPSLQLSRNLVELVRLAGVGSTSGDPAAFSLISTDLNIANQVLTSHDIKIVSNDLDVAGSGSMGLAGAGEMNYTGVAKLAARQTGLTDLLSAVSGATFSNGKLAFPFDLRGTLDHPKFSLRSGQGGSSSPATGSQQNNSRNLIHGITNLFRKKKTPTSAPKP
ncbi:MAG TPA: AsmA family protein [Terriglobia bacterium]|nr:AsmA family protein [Terriglobia bacterium]